MKRFEGKVAIVTGGGAGMGKGYVQGFCKEGAKVVIAELNEASGKKLEEELTSEGYDTMFFKTDVSDEENVKALISATVKKYGKIDILVNNAQFTSIESVPVEETTTEAVLKCFNTGFLGTFFCTKYAVPYMKAQKFGRIVNVSSATGVNGMEYFTAYGPQKEAIRSFTKICAKEFGAYAITCNVICPGALTEGGKVWAEKFPDQYAASCEANILKHMGDVDTELVPPMMFLCSEDAQYITGQTIGIDGGQTMM